MPAGFTGCKPKAWCHRFELAFSQIRPNEKKESTIAFLKDAVTYYRSLGMKITGIMTNNGSGCCVKAFAKLCRQLRLKHIFTNTYRPQRTAEPSASSRLLCASPKGHKATFPFCGVTNKCPAYSSPSNRFRY